MTINNRIIAVKLTPKASANRVGEKLKLPNGDEELSVYVTAPPDKNKANQAMLKLLAKHFDVAITRLKIVQGQTSRHKLVKIE